MYIVVKVHPLSQSLASEQVSRCNVTKNWSRKAIEPCSGCATYWYPGFLALNYFENVEPASVYESGSGK